MFFGPRLRLVIPMVSPQSPRLQPSRSKKGHPERIGRCGATSNQGIRMELMRRWSLVVYHSYLLYSVKWRSCTVLLLYFMTAHILRGKASGKKFDTLHEHAKNFLLLCPYKIPKDASVWGSFCRGGIKHSATRLYI